MTPEEERESAGEGKRTRCGGCRKARALLYSCKCGGSFCLKHLGAEAHGCQYDYLEGNRRALAARLKPVCGEKVPPV